MGELFRRIRYLISRRRFDAELENDMEFHREMAARAGRSNFGNTLRMREQAQEAWGWTWLDRLLQDLRYATRILARSPGFTIAAVLVLMIGIGVNIVAFTVFNWGVLQPLPVRDPGSLLRLQRRSPEIIAGEMPYPTAIFYRDHSKTLSAVMTMMSARLELDDTQPARINFVSANFFSELGARALYGRLLDPARDDAPSAPTIAVLGHDYWQRHFDADPNAVGRIISLNHKQVLIVGVEPVGFPGLGTEVADLWLPITQQPTVVEGSKVLTDTSNGSVRVWARLATGATAQMAEQELLQLTNELRKQHPNDIWKDEYIRSDPGGRLIVLDQQKIMAMSMLGALAFLILAVACANLGGLLLARGAARQHEIVIRLAIGASRWRVFRQLFTESFLLAVLGSAAGLGFACAALRVILVASDSPKWMSAVPDWRVSLFIVGMALITSILFGFAPALQMARQQQKKTLIRQVLVGAQVAASCVLVIVSGLLVRAVQHTLYTDPGFGYKQTVSIDPGLGKHGYKPAAARAYLDQLETRIRSLPGVASVSLVKLPPMGHSVSRVDTEVDGHPLQIYPNWVDPEFMGAMGIPVLLGRNFLPGEKNAVIVSQSLAQKQWPGENPLGKRYWGTSTVVGVVGNARINSLHDDDTVEIYQPVQLDDMPDLSLVLKATGDPDSLLPELKSAVQTLDPKLFPEINLLKTSFNEMTKSLAIAVFIISLVGILALLLAAVGILGLVAYAVSQRTKEIAIRFALGAKRAQVLAAVLRQFSWPILLGLAGGTGIAAATSKVLRRILFGVSNLDPAAYVGAISILAAVVTVAALIPARRALRINVAKALHYE